MVRRGFARLSRVASILGMLAVPSTLMAHPIHSSYATLSHDAARGVVEISLRVFADDFSADVAKHAGLVPSRAPSERDIDRYLGARIALVDRGGRAIALVGCGVRKQGLQLFICLRGTVAGLAGARLRHTVLTDVFRDQVNVVQLRVGTASRTLLFVPGDGAKALTVPS